MVDKWHVWFVDTCDLSDCVDWSANYSSQVLHVAYLPISGSYFSRCLFLKGIFKCLIPLWLLLAHCDYSWHGTTPGPWHRALLIASPAFYRWATALNVGTVVSCSSITQWLTLQDDLFSTRPFFVLDLTRVRAVILLLYTIDDQLIRQLTKSSLYWVNVEPEMQPDARMSHIDTQ